MSLSGEKCMPPGSWPYVTQSSSLLGDCAPPDPLARGLAGAPAPRSAPAGAPACARTPVSVFGAHVATSTTTSGNRRVRIFAHTTPMRIAPVVAFSIVAFTLALGAQGVPSQLKTSESEA